MTTGTIKQTRWAGPFTSGELPLSFNYKFDEADINMTGFTLAATLEDDDGTEMAFAGSVAWDNASIGQVTVKLGADDVAVPASKLVITRRLMVWAGNGTDRVASLEIKYNCHPAIGTPPII